MRAAKRLVSSALLPFGYQIVKRQDVHSLKEHLRYVFADQQVDCVIDVGAHRGDYGSFLRAAGYGGRIISFEPVERSYRELSRNCAGDATWTAVRLALGSREETREIAVTDFSEFSSFRTFSAFGSEAFAAQSRVEHRERVDVRRLDAVLPQLLEVDTQRIFLKLDTQGWDIEVLEGASGCLDRIVALQLEVSARPIYEGVPSYLEALGYATSLGFHLTDAVPVVRDRRNRVIEFDCVLARDVAARGSGG